MKVNLTDYIVLRELVEAVLPKLNFHLNSDHALVGHALLAMLNRVGARLIYDSLNRKEVSRMATVGEEIDARVKVYVELYERFRADEEFRDRARNLATYDLIMQGYVAKQALARVEEHIRVREGMASAEP